MASLNAKAVALDAIEIVEKGGKVNHRSLLLKHGYSDKMSRNPDRVIKTQSYQEVIQKAVGKMEDIRMKALLALQKKDFNQEKAVPLSTVVDVMTKNTQLMTGKATENVGMNVSILDDQKQKLLDILNDNA